MSGGVSHNRHCYLNARRGDSVDSPLERSSDFLFERAGKSLDIGWWVFGRYSS